MKQGSSTKPLNLQAFSVPGNSGCDCFARLPCIFAQFPWFAALLDVLPAGWQAPPPGGGAGLTQSSRLVSCKIFLRTRLFDPSSQCHFMEEFCFLTSFSHEASVFLGEKKKISTITKPLLPKLIHLLLVIQLCFLWTIPLVPTEDQWCHRMPCCSLPKILTLIPQAGTMSFKSHLHILAGNTSNLIPFHPTWNQLLESNLLKVSFWILFAVFAWVFFKFERHSKEKDFTGVGVFCCYGNGVMALDWKRVGQE